MIYRFWFFIWSALAMAGAAAHDWVIWAAAFIAAVYDARKGWA